MWLLKKIEEIKKEEESFYGGKQGEYQTVAQCVLKDLSKVFPFGFYSEPKNQGEIVFLKGQEKDLCLGTILPPKEKIEKGESLIFNDSGAKIHLKKDGSVVINGGLIVTKEGKIIVRERP